MEMQCSKLMVYPAPAGSAGNGDFAVRVREPGGEWTGLFSYNVTVDMHEVRNASMVTFDCSGAVEVEVSRNDGEVREVVLRPLSADLKCEWTGNRIRFTLNGPCQLSLEINGDRFHNLHIFANPLEQDIPGSSTAGVMLLEAGTHEGPDILHNLNSSQPEGGHKILYFSPGLHRLSPPMLAVPSNTRVYVSGGAVIYGGFVCNQVHDVVIHGRGILYLSEFEKTTYYRGVEINYSSNIQVEGITVIDPPHYTIHLGQSENVEIQYLKSFSTRGWSDGIDMMSCRNVRIGHVFMRNSDDCIAIYGSRGEFRGDTRNVTVEHSILWADVAHPINIGTHGNYELDGDIIENIRFHDIDILEHHEPQPDYWGCMAINAGDKNTVRNITYDNIRVESFELGELFNLRVLQNPKYNPAPGNGIENIHFKNISYSGDCGNPSHLEGYDECRMVKNIIFENVVINGRCLEPASGELIIGPYVSQIHIRS